MLKVATQPTVNPVKVVAEKLDIKISVVPLLHLPMKLVIGHSMIGLGDIVIPSLFLSYCMKFDFYTSGKTPNMLKGEFGYFGIGLIGYAVGLITTMIIASTFDAPQPALLYLVPSTLIPICVNSVMLGDFGIFWRGFELYNGKHAEV